MLRPLTSPFQQRIAEGDLAGNRYASFKNASDEVSLILIDLVDERGGEGALGGGYATKLNEFWGAGGRVTSRGAEQRAFGTDKHFERWAAGADRFVAELRAHGRLHRAVVLGADWASTYEDGKILQVPDWMTPPREANEACARYFDRLSALGLHIITLAQERVHTSRNHEWGSSPFHYPDAAHEYFACENQRAMTESDAQEHDHRATDVKVHVYLERRDTEEWGDSNNIQFSSEIAAADLTSGLLAMRQNCLPFDLLADDIGAQTTLVSLHAAQGGSGLQPPTFAARTVSDGIGLNPIFDYLEERWDDLGRLCLGAKGAEESREVLERHPRTALRRNYADGFENSVIYVQNSSAGPVRTQMVPWLEASDGKGETSVLLGDWGRGPALPAQQTSSRCLPCSQVRTGTGVRSQVGGQQHLRWHMRTTTRRQRADLWRSRDCPLAVAHDLRVCCAQPSRRPDQLL